MECIEVTAAITDYVPNRRYRYESRFGSMTYFLRYTFEPVEAGSKLTLDTEAKLVGMFRLLAPLVVRMTQRMYRRDLDNMKEVLEGQGID